MRHFSAQACANLSAAAREREARAGMSDREPGQRELFCERLRRLRSERGLTQREFADRVGCKKQSHVSNWEAGAATPGARFLPAIARLFNVTTDYLLTGHEAGHVVALHRAIRIGASREQMLALIGADADV